MSRERWAKSLGLGPAYDAESKVGDLPVGVAIVLAHPGEENVLYTIPARGLPDVIAYLQSAMLQPKPPGPPDIVEGLRGKETLQ